MGAIVVIPPGSDRGVLRAHDADLRKERDHIERVFSKLEHSRRVATRYDKIALSFVAFLDLAAIHLWLE